MIIDATNMVMGRVASFAAGKALLGETISIINCEKAIVTGNRDTTLKDYREKAEKGSMAKGPFTFKNSERLFKRVIRGMLPYKKEKGEQALKRIKCYIGVPDEFKDKKTEQLKNMDISKMKVRKYITIKEISKMIGGRV